MPASRDDWRGRIDGRQDPDDALVIEVPLRQGTQGGSGTFLAQGADKRRWWVKPQNSPQGRKVVATEFLVGQLGKLIEAPVCEVSIVRIPAEIAGWEYRQGAKLEAGFACGSLAVPDAQEARSLTYREKDDNRKRHVGVYALYDWCWGGDDQWLYCESDDRKVYSHDHGWYLPENGPEWSEATLVAHVAEAHPPVYPADGLDPEEVARMSGRLEAVNRDGLAQILRRLPKSWPVPDADLEALGYFLEVRAQAVAARLRALPGGKP